MSAGPLGWLGNADRIRNARSNLRGVLSQAQVSNPYVFIATDHPLEALAPAQQRRAKERLAALANAPASGMTDDWKSEVDPSISLEANERAFLEMGAALPEEEREGGRFMEEETVRSIQQNRARDQILEFCTQMDDAGIDGAEVMSLLLSGQSGPSIDRAREAGIDVDEIDQALGDIADAFDENLVVEAIEECRSRLQGPQVEEQFTEAELIERLRSNLDVGPAANLEGALENLGDQMEEAQQEGREQALNRLSRSFGIRFDSLDEAVQRLQERIERGRGPTVRSAPIVVRKRSDEVRVRIDDGPEFNEFRDNVRRRVSREIDVDEIPVPSRVGVGTIRLEDGELAEINLEQGAERFGRTAEPEPTPGVEPEETGLPDPENEAEELADGLIRELEGGG